MDSLFDSRVKKLLMAGQTRVALSLAMLEIVKNKDADGGTGGAGRSVEVFPVQQAVAAD